MFGRKHRKCIVAQIPDEVWNLKIVAPPKGTITVDHDNKLVIMSIETWQEVKDHMCKGEAHE